MYIFFRYYMKNSQIGNGVISYGTCTPWGDDAMPRGHTGWYPFHGLVRYIFRQKLPDCVKDPFAS